ncbi:hypothetical protein RSAG8_06383, partial [Rhizoctonia solani AG-8 WAC10335]
MLILYYSALRSIYYSARPLPYRPLAICLFIYSIAMPGPSSPGTKKKAQLAKEKQRRERSESPMRRPPSKDYRPDADSIIWTLPENVTEPEKHWWDQFVGQGKSFDKHRGPRGSHNGARAWTRGMFCTKWWSHFYPQYPDVSDEDKVYYFANMKIGQQIYSYLDNTTRREDTTSAAQSSGNTVATKPSFKLPRLKRKVLAHDQWRRSNIGVYRARIDKYTTEFGEPNFGRRRALSSAEFQELPEADKAKWQKKADNALKEAREAAKLVDPKARAEFMKAYLKEFRWMLEDLEQIAGVKMCALILHETSEGKYRITRELSDGIKDFGKSPALVSAMGAFQKWYQDTANTTVDNPVPLPAVYPDYSNNYIPLLPDFAGISLDPARHLMRTYINAIFRFQGAVGKVMWKEIKDALDYWLDPALLPAAFDDPSHLPLPVVLVWLDFFHQSQCQEGDVPMARRFHFRRVPAGLKPIDKSDSQETAREEGLYKGKKSIILVFDQPVTRCHHPGGMNYSEDSLKYAEFLNTGLTEPDLDGIDLPDEWMSLPILGTDTPEPLIPEAVEKHTLDLANRLPEAQTRLATRLLQALDEHEAHLPATHPQGVYQCDEPPPKLIPPTPDSDSWPTSMWPHSDYFKHPSKAAYEGTVAQYETWLEHIAKVLVHELSGTLYGGKNGIVCVVRSLIQLLFTFSAVRGDFDPPEPIPEDYNTTRFPINQWPLLLEWIEDWITAIETSTAILRKTSSERRKGLAALRSTTDDDELTSYDRVPVFPSPPSPVCVNSVDPTSPAESSQAPVTKKPTIKKRVALKSSVPKRKDKGPALGSDKEPEASAESEDEKHSREIDFEELDRTSQDEMSDEDHGSNIGGELDDHFQPGDLLGIRAKYNYDVNLPQQACVPNRVPAGYSPTDFVFGKFTDLPELIPLRVTTPEGVVKLILAFKVEAKRVKDQCIEDEKHSREIDFEELDRTSQDEMSDEDHGSNIGGELDDHFQPGDLLGIRAKYNYDVNLPQQAVRGTGSITLSSYAGYSPTDFVFGKFTDLPELIPSRVTTPEGVVKLILAFKVEAKRVKDQCIKFGADNPIRAPRRPNELRRQWILASQQWAPAQFQPVFQWLFTVREVWMRAQALAPLVFSQVTAIGYVLREGLQFHTIADNIIRKGVFSDPLVSRDYLQELVRESKVLTIELQWILECLLDWNTFSSHHYNEMKGAFIRDRPPRTLTETAALCQATLEFRDQAVELRKTMCQNLAKLWRDQLKDYKSPQNEELPGFFFSFGAPDIQGIESVSLRSNLAHLQDVLAASTVQDEVLEISLAPVASTSIPSDNPPPSTHSAAAVTTTAPHTSPAPVAPSPAQVITKTTTPTAETPPSIAEAATETAETTGTPRPRPRPKIPLPPSTGPAEELTANPQQLSGTQGSAEVPGIEPETTDLGVKRKRGPNSPKAPTRASTRKRVQTRTQDSTQASVEAQETTAVGAPTPRTTRSQRKVQNTGSVPETVARSLRPRKK